MDFSTLAQLPKYCCDKYSVSMSGTIHCSALYEPKNEWAWSPLLQTSPPYRLCIVMQLFTAIGKLKGKMWVYFFLQWGTQDGAKHNDCGKDAVVDKDLPSLAPGVLQSRAWLGLPYTTLFCENVASLSQLDFPKNNEIGVSGKVWAISRALLFFSFWYLRHEHGFSFM